MTAPSVGAALRFVAGAAERAHDSGELPTEACLNTLFGVRVAAAAGVAEAAPLLRRWASRAAAAVRTGGFDPYQHDPRLLLTCCLAGQESGCRSDVLFGFATQVAEALVSPGGRVPASLGGEAVLLAALGLGSGMPVRPLRVADLPVEPSTLLRANRSVVSAVAELVAGATRLGTAPPPGPVRTALRDVVPVLMLQTLKVYDLIRGSALLRTVRYLGLGRGPEASSAQDYLLSQQREDGRFGYFAGELARRPDLTDPDVGLYLPVTVAVMWALAETAVAGFSLIELRV